MQKAKGVLLIIWRKSGYDINPFPHLVLAILLSHCKLLDGDREVSGPGLVCYLCVWPGYSCISVPAWTFPITPSLLAGFPGLYASYFIRGCSPVWIWIFVGAGPQGAKALVAANGSKWGALHASPICVSVRCHDLGMQLLLSQLPAGHSNFRCVFFICLYM